MAYEYDSFGTMTSTKQKKKTSTTLDITKPKSSDFGFSSSYDFTFKSEPVETKSTTVKVETPKKSTVSNTDFSDGVSTQAEVAKIATQTATKKNSPLTAFGSSLSKSERYRQIATNLSTLAGENLKTYNDRSAAWGSYNKILGGVTAGVTAINGWAGLAVGVVGGLINLFDNSGKYKENAQLYSNMHESITSYLTNLTNRDTTIMNTMDQIYSSMDNLRGAYGSQFVDMMYNYYLAKSGMTSDAYSLLTGNFETFEDIGYGKVSSENSIFDTLTDGNQALFNNVYAQLTLEDITGNKNLLDSMVQSLYGANTELGIQLRDYENELRNVLINSRDKIGQMMFQGRSQLNTQNAEARSENISATEQIANAEAQSASSGVRGGTTGNNASLARLSRDLGQIQRAASTASILGTLKYNVLNAQKNASATAYSYRSAQKKSVIGALNENVSSWNNIGRTAKGAERSSNYYLSEAQANERKFRDDFKDVAERDKDRFFAATT